eukprot:TRINITY_DN7111_c0_g1_i2.p1 TRINITY_DN7111_c0_g1~~TRINITY_DN7111_c0_g1_i2.p1  ORF type:complete len:340 (-),score=117.22 TRINITY_DN7111_c0_g1_i2:207-1226(-)
MKVISLNGSLKYNDILEKVNVLIEQENALQLEKNKNENGNNNNNSTEIEDDPQLGLNDALLLDELSIKSNIHFSFTKALEKNFLISVKPFLDTDEDDDNEEIEDLEIDNNRYYKINIQQFIDYFRTEDTVYVVRQKNGILASKMIRVMLSAGGALNGLLETQIVNLLIENDESDNVHSDVNELIKILLSEELLISQQSRYIVDIGKIINILQEDVMDKIIKEKFGLEALRIFRLLIAKKQLSEQQMEREALLPTTRIRELLCKMFQQNYVILQELGISEKKYFWSVSRKAVKEQQANELCAILLKLKQRYEKETENQSNKQVLIFSILRILQTYHRLHY